MTTWRGVRATWGRPALILERVSMTNIYESAGSTGVVDVAKARDALAGTGGLHNRESARITVAEVTAAALLDIAASLRVIAAEAELGLPSVFADVMADGDTGEVIEPARAFDVGDVVTIAGDPERGVIEAFGEDQGETYARVRYGDDVAKFYLRNLEHATDDPAPVFGTTANPLVTDEEFAAGLVEVAAPDAFNDLDADLDDVTVSEADGPDPEPKPKKKGGKR